MVELLAMWALVEVLGFVCLPLTMTVFHNLPDRGWAFSKAIGVAVLAFGVWLPLMVFHALFFNQLLIASVLLIMVIVSVVGFLRTRQTLIKLVRTNLGYLLISEIVFLGMVFLLGWIRSYGPDIRNFEMFMDEGFVAAIMRSPHFPPSDMWYSGYSLNYYYYAHYTIALLAKLLGQSPSIAFNTGISIFFGLTAVNLFGVTSNIVGWARHQRRVVAELPTDVPAELPENIYPRLLGAAPYGVLTLVMGLILGNLAATQQWWREHGDINQFDWFAPSRVVDKTINEFPAFSFLLSCFHAHVLALAFTIVAIGLALNLFMGTTGRGLKAFGRGWQLPLTLVTTAVILGALFTMNGWDFPTYVGLAVVCIVLQQWLASNRHFDGTFLLDTFIAAGALVLLAFVLYTPFYLNFISPSQGLGIVGPADRSPLGNVALIYGIFAFVFVSLLIVGILRLPLFAEGRSEEEAKFGGSGLSSLRGTLLSFSIMGVVGLVTLVILPNGATFVVAGLIAAIGAFLVFAHLRDRSLSFVLLLGVVAFALIAFCEVVFLRDVFADNYPRMNTVFKFYFQCWALLSIVSGAGLFFLLEAFRTNVGASVNTARLQAGLQIVWSVLFCLFLLAGAIYPLAGTYARTNHYAQRSNSLDGLDYMQQTDLADYEAIHWLNSHVEGVPVIVEALGPDYSEYGRVSAFTGLPTLMGWSGHEYQWRVRWLDNPVNALDFNSRSTDKGGDIERIYTSSQPAEVLNLLRHYQVSYIYVGPLELAKYPTINLQKFGSFLHVVYAAKGVIIYKVTI